MDKDRKLYKAGDIVIELNIYHQPFTYKIITNKQTEGKMKKPNSRIYDTGKYIQMQKVRDVLKIYFNGVN